MKYSFGLHTNKTVEILFNHFKVDIYKLNINSIEDAEIIADCYAEKFNIWQHKNGWGWFNDHDRIYAAIMYFFKTNKFYVP